MRKAALTLLRLILNDIIDTIYSHLKFIRMKKQYLIFLVLLLTSSLQAFTQGTLEDYKRAEAAGMLYANKIFNAPTSFNWLKDSDKFWYLNTSRSGKEFIGVDAAKKSQQPLFDHERLAKSLAQKSGKKINPKAL